MSKFAQEYNLYFPENYINSNYYLNLPNFEYNRYSFFPYSKLYNRLILLDDCINLKCVSKIINITANQSRKNNLYLILSAQYEKFVSKSLREMAEFYIEVNLDYVKNGLLTENSSLYVNFIDLNYDNFILKFENILQFAKLNIYDTKQNVVPPLDKYVLKEIFNVSSTKDDIEMNLLSYYSKTQYSSIFKKFYNYSIKELKSFSPEKIQNILLSSKSIRG